MNVEWGKAKFALLFFGLVCQALASRDPLSIHFGVQIKECSEVLWAAFYGTFAYLLKPPAEKPEP